MGHAETNNSLFGLHDNLSLMLFNKLFQTSILLKGINGLLQTLGGIFLLLSHSTIISKAAVYITHTELSINPDNLRYWVALYLLINGTTKICLVIAIMQKRFWAFPLSMALLGCFILFQIYRLSFNHSPELVILIVFNIFVIGLLKRQYELMKST